MPATRSLWGVWAATPDSIFSVGDAGTIVLTDTTREYPVVSPSTENLRGVWGRSAHEVFVVGDFGTVLTWDGQTWRIEPTPSRIPLFAVAGDADSIYAVGQDGVMLRRNAGTWAQVPVPTTELLSAVSVSPNRAIAVGNAGVVLWRVSGGWRPAAPLGASLLTGVALTPGGAAAVGVEGDIFEYDGARWQTVVLPGRLLPGPLWAVDALDDVVFAVGDAGAIWKRGTVWERATNGIEQLTWDSWSSESGNTWVCGEAGLMLHHDGTRWMRQSTPTRTNLVAIWGSGAVRDTVYTLGSAGRVLVNRGGVWATDRARLPFDPALHAIGGTSASDVWVAGDAGAVIHRNAGGWSSITRLTPSNLHGVWVASRAVVWVVGETGTTVRRGHDLRWRTPPSPSTPVLYDVAGFTNPDSTETVFAVGEAGAVWEWLSDAWRETPPITNETLRAVTVGRGRVVYAAGDRGTVIARVQGTWQTVHTPYTSDIRSIRATPDFQLYLTGGDGPGRGLLARYGPAR